MKKLLVLILVLFVGISFTLAENQRYMVSHKDGKARFVPVEKSGENWKYVRPITDVYLENGVEVEGFKINPDKSLNYTGTPYVAHSTFIIRHEGKYYVDPFPDKDLKPIDENGNLTSELGIRNYLSNTAVGTFYLTKTPGLIALVCTLFSGIFLLLSLSRGSAPLFMRWMAMLPLCIISLLEIGAAFSLGTEAAWWVNPDDVGYWIATPLLIPYSITALLMVFSYKLYKRIGRFDGPVNIIVSSLLIIGMVLTVISFIFVIINFVYAACCLIFLAWFFRGFDHKDSNGNTINYGPFSTHKTDRYGNTTRIN
ncbi:MAG: hypothetical protein K2N48_06865 [Muribaculaceae bacterium]|nr:hypothetical protein [Muribaculaceae bacterium]